jgi:ABC-type oligopeptide transport system ATPase subunit
MTSSEGALLSVRNLKKYFPVGSGFLGRSKAMLKAVDGVNFDIEPGKTYGLVGESGCGKTTTAKMILLLEEPTDGGVSFEGADAL